MNFFIIIKCTRVNFEMNDVKVNLQLYHSCIMLSLLIFIRYLYHVCILTFVIFENKTFLLSAIIWIYMYLTRHVVSLLKTAHKITCVKIIWHFIRHMFLNYKNCFVNDDFTGWQTNRSSRRNSNRSNLIIISGLIGYVHLANHENNQYETKHLPPKWLDVL